MTDPSAAAPAITLDETEARVIGALMEKCVTTPDGYPLSLNALVNACNQSTNRDPIVHFDEQTVESALDALREKGLVRRLKAAGQRVIKYRHSVDDAMGLEGGEFAVIGVLLLRGAQTPGELKGRTERWHGFASLEQIDATLDVLAGRGLVQRLERRPGQKEARWIELLRPHMPGADGADRAVPTASVSRPAAVVAATPDEPAVDDAAQSPVATGIPHSLDVRNPVDGSVIRSVAIDGEHEITSKLARARRAQPGWAAWPYAERATALRAFRDLLEREAEECARLTTTEMGKPIREARNEVRAVLERIEWNLEHAEAVLEPRVVTPDGATQERITYEPLGVVAHVSAWNYPYFVALNSVVPALLTGNAVLFKPSEHATLTGLRLVDLLHRAGVPVDVVQAVVGEGPTGAALVESGVDMVCFTGSYATGRRVAIAAAGKLTRAQLELGGKDPAYVTDDVDVEAAALAAAEGTFYNAGQSCCAIERLYVHERVYQPFVDALVEIATAYRVGDPVDEQTDMGPVARRAQLDVLDAHVRDALGKGARLCCGGERVDPDGAWFAPTVLADCNDRMAVMRDETFGPVIGVQRVADDDEAIALMGATEYGLTASVFARSGDRARGLLDRLDVGSAYWNCSDRTSVRLPWAGRRHSGLGVSLSEAGLRTFVRGKAWHLRPELS